MRQSKIPILVEPINRYLANLLPERDAILTEMEYYAQDTHFPIVGPQVGRLLFQYSRLMHAKHIFEMGSGFGYSAYWFYLGAPRAQIILTDTSQHSLNLAEKWFKRSGITSQCQFIVGDARETLIQAGGVYDIIFIDVDKDAYPRTFHTAINYLKKGGLLITDNTLWHGKVTEESPEDEDIRAVKMYNKLIFNTPGIFSTILPVRDGVAISLKI